MTSSRENEQNDTKEEDELVAPNKKEEEQNSEKGALVIPHQDDDDDDDEAKDDSSKDDGADALVIPRQEDEDDSSSCPVCLTTECSNMVSGPCRHTFCMPCMERVLNAEASMTRWPPQSATDIHLSAPTLGRCPICRSELSLFEVVDSNIAMKELLYPPYVEYHLQEHHPLKDSVYVPYRGKVGQLSFHWDWYKIKNMGRPLPFFNLTETIQRNPDKWRLESGTLAPRIKYMEEGCHFHQSSRTFHGKILWEKDRLNGSYEWDIVLGFPKDYRFLSSGRIHMKRELQNIHDDELPQEYTMEQKQLCRFPFDGRWTVQWKNPAGEGKSCEVHVKNSEYVQSGWSFHLNFDDRIHPSIRWPKSKHKQTVVEGVNLTEEPMGPKVGSKIRWTSTSPNFPELVWIRQTVGPLPLPKVILFGMGQDKVLYQRLNAKTDDSIPKYHGHSVWGNIFCKRLYVGSASYHFLSPTNCYISYQHPACRDLPALDDGTPLPTRVDFHDVVFEPLERKLMATIEWEDDFGTSWNDNVRWTLTMYFDSQYMVILKGGIQCEWCQEQRARSRPPRQPNPNRPAPVPVYVPPPETPTEQPLDRNEEWVMSGYGHDQLYINAAMLERYRDNTVVVDYNAISKDHCERLAHEGATKRSVDFVAHLFSLAAENPNSNPIDFLL